MPDEIPLAGPEEPRRRPRRRKQEGPPVLNYMRPQQPDEPAGRVASMGWVLGAVVIILSIGATAMSALAASSGSLLPARLFVPWSMLAAAATGGIGGPSIALGASQGPLYAMLIILMDHRGKLAHACVAVAIAHVLAAAAAVIIGMGEL